MNKKLLLIAVAYHKFAHVVNCDAFIPIQVGSEYSKEDLGITRDNTNDNISSLNPYYCELTALYYLWKNIKGYKYYGLCHYRRFPTFKRNNFFNVLFQNTCFFLAKIIHVFNSNFHYSIYPYIVTTEGKIDEELKKFQNNINKYLYSDKYDFFAPRQFVSSTYSNYEKFAIDCGFMRINELRDIISKYYPKYLPELTSCLKSNKMRATNIVIFRDNIFESYCTFIFDILEKHMNLNISNPNTISNQYLRQSGYLAEILTDVFIRKLIKEQKKSKKFNILYVVPDNDINRKNIIIRLLIYLKIFNPKFI